MKKMIDILEVIRSETVIQFRGIKIAFNNIVFRSKI